MMMEIAGGVGLNDPCGVCFNFWYSLVLNSCFPINFLSKVLLKGVWKGSEWLFFFFVTWASVVTTAVGPETCAFGSLYGKLLLYFFLCCHFVVVFYGLSWFLCFYKINLKSCQKNPMLFFVTNVLEIANLFNQRLRELPFCESLLTEHRNVIAAQ